MEKAEKLQILNECYAEAVRAGRAKTRKEFANLYGINPSSLSAAFNGDDKYLTDNLIGRLMKDMPLSSAEIEQEMVLVIPTGARAGTLADFSTSVAQYDCERMVTPIKGADFAIQKSFLHGCKAQKVRCDAADCAFRELFAEFADCLVRRFLAACSEDNFSPFS